MRYRACARVCADAPQRVSSEISGSAAFNRTGRLESRPRTLFSFLRFVRVSTRYILRHDAFQLLSERSTNPNFQPSSASAAILYRRKRTPGTAPPTPNPVVNFVSRLEISSLGNIRVSGNKISKLRSCRHFFRANVTGMSVTKRPRVLYVDILLLLHNSHV